MHSYNSVHYTQPWPSTASCGGPYPSCSHQRRHMACQAQIISEPHCAAPDLLLVKVPMLQRCQSMPHTLLKGRVLSLQACEATAIPKCVHAGSISTDTRAHTVIAHSVCLQQPPPASVPAVPTAFACATVRLPPYRLSLMLDCAGDAASIRRCLSSLVSPSNWLALGPRCSSPAA